MPEMTIKLCMHGSFWSVVVNGYRLVDRESYSIASRIYDELKTPGCHGQSEAAEVARSIVKWAEHCAVKGYPIVETEES